MKTLKNILKICFAIILTVMAVSQDVKADELPEINVMSTVLIKANVPEDFTENIAFVLEDEITQVQFAFALTKQNEYAGSLSILGDRTYLAVATFPSSSQYKLDLAEKYDIVDEEVELVFQVTPIIYSIENDEGETQSRNEEESDASDQEDEEQIEPETGLPTAKIVLEAYEEKVSFIQDNPNFSTFLELYSGGMFKKYYLNADSMNTEEQWDNMKEIDRFNYYITYYMPYMKIINYEFLNANEFIEELVAQKNILSQIDNGDIVYDAIVDIWKWHYSYWQNTGTVYNFYNYYDGVNAGELTVSETIKLYDQDEEEFEGFEESEESEKAETEIEEIVGNTGSPVISWIKNNWLTTSILFISGISFLVVFLRNRRENISDESNK